MNVMEVNHLKKDYGKIHAVQDISFHVEEGELFGFLGVNGAGKSTTIQMLCTLFTPSGGSANICGYSLGKHNQEIRKRIGLVSQQNCLDDALTIKENLMIRGSLYEQDPNKLKVRLQEVSNLLKLDEILTRPFQKLSGGQKRRCEIARALMHSPKILFLDEPTTGLDPATRQSVWYCIDTLRKHTNMTVFLTTHYMEEAAQADHIALIDHGLLMEYGTPYELKEAYAKDRLVLHSHQIKQLETILSTLPYPSQKDIQHITISLTHTKDAIEILDKVKPYINGFEVLQGTMDDVFLHVTGKTLKEEGETNVCI